jgi:hypothetical protein
VTNPFLLWILRKRPHLVDQSAFYSSKLKTKPVKIAFLVDIAGHAKAEAERRSMLFCSPLVTASTQNNANNARTGIFFQHHNDTFQALATQDGHLGTLLV